MKNASIYYFLISLFLSPICGFANPDKVDSLFNKAVEWVIQGQEAEQVSFINAKVKYEAAFKNLKIIISQYPKSMLARRLIREGDQVYLGNLTVNQFVDHVLPSTQAKAAAENDLFACANFLANTLTSTEEKSWVYTQIALSYAKAKRIREYQEYFSTALQSAESLPDQTKKGFLVWIATQLINTGLYDDAVKVVNKTDNSDLKLNTLFAICDHAANNNQKALAQTFLARLLQTVQSIEPMAQRVGKLQDMIEKFSEIKSKELACQGLISCLKVSETILNENDREFYFFAGIDHLVKIGELDSALALANHNKNPDSYRQAKLLADIARQYVAIGQIEKALNVAQTITELYQKSSNQAMLATWVLPDVARVYISDRQPDKALEITKNISNAIGEKSALLADIARYYALAGQEQQADQLFSESIQAADTLIVARKIRAYNAIAGQFLKTGKKDKALEILDLATIQTDTTKSLSIIVHIFKQYSYFAKQYIQMGQIERAQQALSCSSALTAQTYFDHINCFLELKYYDEAFSLTDKLPKDVSFGSTEIERTMKETAQKFIKSGQYEQAMKIVEWLQSRPNSSEGHLNEIAQKFIEAGQFEPALKIVDWFQSQPRKSSYHDYKLSEIGFKFAKAGQYERALEIAESIKQNPNSEPLKAEIAAGFAEVGKLEQSLSILESIQSLSNKASVVAGIASTFAKSGKKTTDARLFAHKIIAVTQFSFPYALEKIAREVFAALVNNNLTSVKKMLPSPMERTAMRLSNNSVGFDNEWEHFYRVPWYSVWVAGTAPPMQKPDYNQFRGLKWLNFNTHSGAINIRNMNFNTIPGVEGIIEACFSDAPFKVKITLLRVGFVWRIIDIGLDIGGVHQKRCNQ
jgi:tetratricopeptide (TPR) repeat protein